MKTKLLLITLLSAFTLQSQTITTGANTVASPQRTEHFIPNSPLNTVGNRVVTEYEAGTARRQFNQSEIAFTGYAAGAERVATILANGNISTQPLTNFAYASTDGVTKSGNTFSLDWSYVMSHENWAVKADTSSVWTRSQSDDRFLQEYTETDPAWLSEKTNYWTKSQSDTRYLQSFTESDPVYTSGIANYWTKAQADGRYLQSFTESDPTVPSYSKTLSSFIVIKPDTDALYQPIGTYATSSNAMALTNKSGSNLMWTNDAGYTTVTATDLLYRPIGYVPNFASITSKPTTVGGYGITDAATATSSTAFTNKSGNISQWTNDSGYITASYTPTITNGVSRPINSTAFTVSTTKQAFVAYNVNISCTATIGSAASGSVALQYSTNSGSSWNTVATVSNSNTVTLAIVLNSVQVSGLQISGYVPANALCRLVSTSSGVNAVISYLSGTEVY